MAPQSREDWIALMDNRVTAGINEYDVRVSQARHVENRNDIKNLQTSQNDLNVRMAKIAGGMVVIIPLISWLLHKFLG